MIISKEHKYAFIENPNTASSAMEKELREQYDGCARKSMIKGEGELFPKHMTVDQYLAWSNAETRRYFMFCTIRNPLDIMVTRYCKYERHEKYTNPKYWIENGGWVLPREREIFDFVVNKRASFTNYLKRYGRRVIAQNTILRSVEVCDYVIRFEDLQEGFAEALQYIGLESKRPLPMLNKTGGKRGSFETFYDEEALVVAERIFGDFMSKLGYKFPAR